MPDLVANLAFRLLEAPLDPVPRYRLLRDVLQWPDDHPDLIAAREQAMQSRHVLDLAGAQLPDGSWGQFRKSDNWPVIRAGQTTETAIIRAQVLAMDRRHPSIVKAIAYLEGLLNRSVRWPDVNALNIGGEPGFIQAVAARLCQIDPGNKAIQPIADQWESIISACLTEQGIDQSVLRDLYTHPVEPDGGQMISAYTLILLRDRLDYPTAMKMTNYLINQARGIFLVNNRSLRYLPLHFESRECQRYLAAINFLADYPSAGSILQNVADWLWEQMNNNGFWDFGKVAKDGLELPLSENWRRKGSREADCTVRILSLMVRLQRSCEVRKAICHVI